jgi:hypothetical protein
MPILDDSTLHELVSALRRRVSAHYPEWTEQSTGDPGTSLVQLFAFLAESLLYRANEIPEHVRQRFLRLAQLALTLPVADEAAPPAPLERVRYSFGMVLGVEDFEAEQNYFRERMRRHNRELHGVGVVRGLSVSVEQNEKGGGEHVAVSPGFAIAPDGEEIAVPERATQALPADGSALYVTVAYFEQPARPVPVLGEESDTAFTRIEESFALSVAPSIPSGAVALARLVRADALWRVDEAFEAVRVRCAGT